MADHIPAIEYNHPAVRKAHKLAENVIREHSRTFYFATALLPPRKRRAVRSLYGFCRATDDLVDRRDAGEAEIEHWRSQVSLPAARQNDPVLLSWAVTREEFTIDRQYEQELIDGVQMDAMPRRFKTWKELERYCYLVASTVGLLALPIIGLARGVKPDLAAAFAVKLGVALQLTNILRDIGEDAARGRVYLPLEDLKHFNLSERDLHRGNVDARFVRLMQFEIRRTRSLYREALPGVALLATSGRAAVGAAAILYSDILREIEALRYDVFSRRAQLSAWKKIVRLPGILLTVFFLRAPKKAPAA